MKINDFDFLHGSWDGINRRLHQRHVGSDEWDEFPGILESHGFFDGAGIFDEVVFPTKGWSGATVRFYEPANKVWSIYWVNSRDGLMTPPVVGRFENGVGTFYGDDVDEGIPIRCRFIWSRITPTSARWEQAFSTDGEKTWETNWTCDFTRRRA